MLLVEEGSKQEVYAQLSKSQLNTGLAPGGTGLLAEELQPTDLSEVDLCSCREE